MKRIDSCNVKRFGSKTRQNRSITALSIKNKSRTLLMSCRERYISRTRPVQYCTLQKQVTLLQKAQRINRNEKTLRRHDSKAACACGVQMFYGHVLCVFAYTCVLAVPMGVAPQADVAPIWALSSRSYGF